MIKLKGKLVLSDRVINGEVVFYGERIVSAGRRDRSTDAICNRIFDYGDAYIAPGFIDIHVHGGGGSDFMDGTAQDFVTAALLHASHGTASMLPTTLTCPDDELFRAFEIYRSLSNSGHEGALFCGMHLEGPYIAASQKGAQDESYLKKPLPEHYNKVLEAGKGIIRRWTVAPELDGAAALGRLLAERGICASMGHSDASCREVKAAMASGYTMLTHFYSGMSTISRKGGFRIAGMLEAGYLFDDLAVEIICDGCHLPDELLQTVYKFKGAGKTALITDAMRGAGQTGGETILGSRQCGQRCIIEDGVAKMPDKTAFAGSICTTDRLLSNAVKKMGASLPDAVRMLTETPAKLVSLNTKGSLKPGFDADFTIFDENFTVIETVSNGKTIYRRV